MKIYFNSLGVITATDFTGDTLRQGSVGITLKAYFDDKNNVNYTATFNFTRSNGSSVAGVVMTLDATDSECYNYKFSDPWFFAKAGTTTLTIYLRDAGGNVIASGQVQFSIEATDYDADPQITITQYNSLLAAVEGKVSNSEAILVFSSMPLPADLANGQVFYCSFKLYKNNNGTIEPIFDFGDHYTKDQIDGFITTLNTSIAAKSTVSGTVDENQHWRTLTIDGITHNIGGSGGGASYVAGTGISIDAIHDTISIDDTVVATKSFLSENYATKSSVLAIGALIPAQASSYNQLADKDFVNSSIATETASFKGTFPDVSTLLSNASNPTNNDYANVINKARDFASTTEMNAYDKSLLTNYDFAWIPNGTKFDLYRFARGTQTWTLQETAIAKTDVSLPTVYNRYTYNGTTRTWAWNFSINTSGFTSAQWIAINSGITPELVSKIKDVEANPTLPSGVSKFDLDALKIGTGYYVIRSVRTQMGGGVVDPVQLKFWKGTQAQYEAIGTGNYDANTMYIITGSNS